MAGAPPGSTGVCRVHPALPFTVDTWDVDQRGDKPGFLTHAHKDHCEGLQEWVRASGAHPRRLFCTEDTWELLRVRYPELAVDRFRWEEVTEGEELSVEHEGRHFSVTPVDANHVAGTFTTTRHLNPPLDIKSRKD
jgi:DNA cross-link repair 1A protein